MKISSKKWFIILILFYLAIYKFSYVLEFLNLKPQFPHIIFIDESGFSLSMRRSFGRAPLGIRENKVVSSIRSKNITLIASISCNKVWTFKVHEGSVNRDVFNQCLDQLFADFDLHGVPNSLIIMDNVKFHKTEVVTDKINNSRHKLLFLPPYSPFLNTIEELFNQIKCIVRNKDPKSKDELYNAIMDSPNEISPQQYPNFFNHPETYFT